MKKITFIAIFFVIIIIGYIAISYSGRASHNVGSVTINEYDEQPCPAGSTPWNEDSALVKEGMAGLFAQGKILKDYFDTHFKFICAVKKNGTPESYGDVIIKFKYSIGGYSFASNFMSLKPMIDGSYYNGDKFTYNSIYKLKSENLIPKDKLISKMDSCAHRVFDSIEIKSNEEGGAYGLVKDGEYNAIVDLVTGKCERESVHAAE